MFNDTESVHRQIINFELVETCFLDHEVTDRKPAYRQHTDGDCAETRGIGASGAFDVLLGRIADLVQWLRRAYRRAASAHRCCARAASGHTAAPANAAINSRRPMITGMRLFVRGLPSEMNDTTPAALGLHVRRGRDAGPPTLAATSLMGS
jgi:hypothetical protein